jgi:hypothetical protein
VAQAISVDGLRALASSLASGTAALRLSADLDAVQSAASRSAVHAAVARFVADCAKLAGPAGELLRAAAAPLA